VERASAARVFLAAAALVAGACSSYTGTARAFAPAELAREPGWIAVRQVTPVRQATEYECGAAAIAMVVSYWTGAAPHSLVAKLRPVPERGLAAGRLREFARAHGLAAFLIQADLSDLEREVAAGRPVLVGLAKPQRRGVLSHYEVVVAVHPASRRIVTLDPGRGWQENTFAGFLAEWRPVRGLALVVSRTAPPLVRARGGTAPGPPSPPPPVRARRSGRSDRPRRREWRSDRRGRSRRSGATTAP
jgi:hypothetical protein